MGDVEASLAWVRRSMTKWRGASLSLARQQPGQRARIDEAAGGQNGPLFSDELRLCLSGLDAHSAAVPLPWESGLVGLPVRGRSLARCGADDRETPIPRAGGCIIGNNAALIGSDRREAWMVGTALRLQRVPSLT